VASPIASGRSVRVRPFPLARFGPRRDLMAPAIGLVGLVAGGISAGDPAWLSVARTVVGAAFLGCVTDAMLLGHWYLTQPGLPRAPLLEQVRLLGFIWPVEVALLLVPVGMVSAFNGSIDDGYGGMLGWFWLACAVTTIGLVGVTRPGPKGRVLPGGRAGHRPGSRALP